MSKGKTKQMETREIISSFHNSVVIDKSGGEEGQLCKCWCSRLKSTPVIYYYYRLALSLKKKTLVVLSLQPWCSLSPSAPSCPMLVPLFVQQWGEMAWTVTHKFTLNLNIFSN